MDAERVERLEAEIADLKKRWPRHGVKPILYQQLEELEERLAEARGQEPEDGAAGTGRLQ